VGRNLGVPRAVGVKVLLAGRCQLSRARTGHKKRTRPRPNKQQQKPSGVCEQRYFCEEASAELSCTESEREPHGTRVKAGPK